MIGEGHRTLVGTVVAAVAAGCAAAAVTAYALADQPVTHARVIGTPAQLEPPNPFLAGAIVPQTLTGPPTRLRISAIGVDTPLDSLSLDASGALVPPAGYRRAGWYAGGPAPGDVGPAVIAGHVDSKSGPAVFAGLSRLQPGALVEVERAGVWVSFRVAGLARFAKSAFPTDDVYGPTPGPELRLVTCGGAFNKRAKSYVDNIVVYAVLAG